MLISANNLPGYQIKTPGISVNIDSIRVDLSGVKNITHLCNLTTNTLPVGNTWSGLNINSARNDILSLR